MSRAFVREGDGDDQPPALRIPSNAVNYVTPRGLDLLRAAVRQWSELRDRHQGLDDLESQSALKEADRELAYYLERLRTAVLVEPVANPKGQVRFGSKVKVMDDQGDRFEVVLVGEDEADVHSGLISYVAPLAKALMGGHVGDEVVWERPLGKVQIEILSVDGVSD